MHLVTRIKQDEYFPTDIHFYDDKVVICMYGERHEIKKENVPDFISQIKDWCDNVVAPQSNFFKDPLGLLYDLALEVHKGKEKLSIDFQKIVYWMQEYCEGNLQ